MGILICEKSSYWKPNVLCQNKKGVESLRVLIATAGYHTLPYNKHKTTHAPIGT